MNRDEIKEQLQTWLLEESELQKWKIGFSENENYYYYCYKILNKNNIDICTICIEKNIERIILMNDIIFSKEDGINYKLSKEKSRYWIDLKISLMNLGIDVQATPDVESMEKIQVRKLIYFDGWSRDRFMRDLFTIMDASELPELLFRDYSDYMNEKIQKD
jgi:hypothetical protein